MKSFAYPSGEEVRRGDRITYHNEPGQVEFGSPRKPEMQRWIGISYTRNQVSECKHYARPDKGLRIRIRDAQFQHINGQCQRFRQRVQPVISIDKKEGTGGRFQKWRSGVAFEGPTRNGARARF